MSYLEQKYINIIGSRLRNFKKKSNTLWNMSCPLCNDSKKNSLKARGYIYNKDDKSNYYCHNCSASMSVSNFIKKVDVNLYNEYILEKLRDEKNPKQLELETFVKKMKKPSFITENKILNGLKKVSQLSHTNPIKKLIDQRMIPTKYHSKLFRCPKFKQFCNILIPNKFTSIEHDETRLLIPYLNKENKLHSINFRSLQKNSSCKYIKLLLDESIPNVYGLDTTDFTKTVFVLEGEFDSMFIDNAIATGGSDLVSAVRDFNKNKLVICYDNEKRSIETNKKLAKAIDLGYNTVIWPSNFEYKDVNDAICGGYTIDQINSIINDNIYNGLSAKLKLAEWSKV